MNRAPQNTVIVLSALILLAVLLLTNPNRSINLWPAPPPQPSDVVVIHPKPVSSESDHLNPVEELIDLLLYVPSLLRSNDDSTDQPIPEKPPAIEGSSDGSSTPAAAPEPISDGQPAAPAGDDATENCVAPPIRTNQMP